MTPHTDSQYEAEIQTLFQSTSRMGQRAEEMVRTAVRSLLERDEALACSVVDGDDILDTDEVGIDRQCLYILVRRAPVGADLRMVMAILKMVTDVERIGDLAVNIAERAIELMGTPGLPPPPQLTELAGCVYDILSQANAAFRDRDAAAARGLYAMDKGIDAVNRAAFQEILHLAADHPQDFSRALAFSSVCKLLERVGDHAVNIGEQVVFMVEGENLRHGRG